VTDELLDGFLNEPLNESLDELLNELLGAGPFSLAQKEKKPLLTAALARLTVHHYENCPQYRGMLDAIGFDPRRLADYHDLPPLPARLFKELTLKSVKDEDVFKTVTSSGTTGQTPARIYLDRATAALQQKALVKTVSAFLGSARAPMIIIDCPSVVKDRRMFSARGAGILGFSIFGSDRFYALSDEMKLDVDGLTAFLAKHRGKRILLFGFTFMVWRHFYAELKKLPAKIDLSEGILFHGGGWKKLADERVAPAVFKAELRAATGLTRVHDYYGMVEQAGSVYIECERGHLHASVFSDVITRGANDLAVLGFGETGVVEVVSALPRSYCGHALLTEDEGVILGEDDCPCGRLGKFFKITGRLKNAEIRGCSDTYASKF
jgi:hypothetical protein